VLIILLKKGDSGLGLEKKRQFIEMDRLDVAYLLNSTPKYFYLLHFHIALLCRYAPKIKWPIFLATEAVDDPVCELLRTKYDVRILELMPEDKGFLESRKAAIRLLPPSIRYVLPMQEDFLLEREVNEDAIKESIEMMDSFSNIASMRWMPCPGPVSFSSVLDRWTYITNKDTFQFTYQATLWKREALHEWFSRLVEQFSKDYPEDLSFKERMTLQIRSNYAENVRGQKYFSEWLGDQDHLAWIRKHKAPNAVYMSPWPYRPTAVTNGKLEDWAIELAKREGFSISV
jgi:hypothetical protein